MSSRNLIVLLFFLFMFVETRSQVCLTVHVLHDYSYKNDEIFCPNCSNVTSVTYSKYQNITKFYECCPGYKLRNATLPPSRSNCIRVCNACSNGNCIEGNVCVCSQEYERYPPQSNTCIHKCRPGYSRLNGICVPICDPGCGTGTCVDVNKCECPKGYWLSNKFPRCVPICKNCYGLCRGPDKCVCEEPFILKHLTADNHDCVCSDDCSTKCDRHVCVYRPSLSRPPRSFYKLGNMEIGIYDNTYTTDPDVLTWFKKRHINNNCSLLVYIYISGSINIILVLTGIIIIWRNPGICKCRRNDEHTNSNDSVQCSYHQYEVIKENALHKQRLNLAGCLQNKTYIHSVVETPVSEESTTQDPFCYDYVQIPIPINKSTF